MRHGMAESVAIDVKSLEWKLECAAVTGWNELSNESAPERIHIAYDADDAGALSRLKLWSSIRRGQWDLVCDYLVKADGPQLPGITFCNGFASKRLESSLEAIMENQECYPPALRLPQGIIQVGRPNAEALLRAEETMAMPREKYRGKQISEPELA